MTNVVQQARYDGLIRRAAGLLGPGSKVSETLSEVFPVFDLENLPFEMQFLAGWRAYFTTQLVTATVGETSRASIFNPAGSGRLVKVTEIWLSTTPAAVVLFGTIATVFASSQVSGLPRDTRSDVGSSAKISNLNTGNTTGIGRWTTENNTTQVINMPKGFFLLAPGTGLDFGTLADNQNLDVTFFWKERDALPSELSF